MQKLKKEIQKLAKYEATGDKENFIAQEKIVAKILASEAIKQGVEFFIKNKHGKINMICPVY